MRDPSLLLAYKCYILAATDSALLHNYLLYSCNIISVPINDY